MTAARFSTGSVVKYATLPRILARMGELFLSGFAQVAYLMAQIYRGVRLLPANHPYLISANIGKFGIRQVIAAAAAHLEWRRENIDQIIVFLALLLGFILLLVQGVMLLVGLVIPEAAAASLLSFQAYFGTPYYGGTGPRQDLAFIMLDRVFGVAGIFESCVSMMTPCYASLPGLNFDTTNPVYAPAVFPWAYHNGLHLMFEFYSIGLLVIATFIIMYFVIVIVAETAQTGTPFGKRFNSVWAPLRLVMALGLLIPITNGLNSAQYITLYLAKYGSNFASNGWFHFNSGHLAWGAPNAIEMIAKPQAPAVEGLLQFMMLAHACKAIEEGYITRAASSNTVTSTTCDITDTDDNIPSGNPSEVFIDAYLVKSDAAGGASDAVRLISTPADTAQTFFNNGDMTIRFGDRGCDNTMEIGRVAPMCGEVVISSVSPSADPSENGPRQIQRDYYEVVRYLWGDYTGNVAGMARQWQEREFCEPDRVTPFLTGNGDMELRRQAFAIVQEQLCNTNTVTRRLYAPGGDYTTPASYTAVANSSWRMEAIQHYSVGDGSITPTGLVPANPDYPGAVTQSSIGPYTHEIIAENVIRQGITLQQQTIAAGNAYGMPADQLSRGWAGAGMWYNHIARLNGSIGGAAANYPKVSRYPQIMESVLAELRQNNEAVTPAEQFSPNQGGKVKVDLPRPNEQKSAELLNNIYTKWTALSDIHKPPTGNAIIDAINGLFGTAGLFALDDPQNQVVNPLAQLSLLGKGLVEASIRNIGIGLIGGVIDLGATLGKIQIGSEAAESVSTFMFAIASATLGAGIVLYYVLPFLPFIYFFFALGNWVKGIFEAMVGVPLWALAHIRIDGNGLPGEAAMNGYYMLFEIFLRPILIVFGLLASVSIFSAMATVLNGIWPIATKNLGGANYAYQTAPGWREAIRGPVDQFFFTVMYAVIMYIMALSSFKLIDLIPNQIMRWLGTAVSTFSDLTQDAAQSLTQYSSIVGQQMSGQAIGGIQKMTEAGKNIGKSVTS